MNACPIFVWHAEIILYIALQLHYNYIHHNYIRITLELHYNYITLLTFLLSKQQHHFVIFLRSCSIHCILHLTWPDRPGFHHCLWGAVRLPLLGHHCVVCTSPASPPVENGIWRDSEVCKGNSEFLLDPISDSGEQCTKSIWDGHVCYLCGQFSSSSSKTRHKLYQQIPQIIFLKSPVTAAQRERERDTLSPLSNVTDVGMMWDWPKANYPCMTCSHHMPQQMLWSLERLQEGKLRPL